MEKQPIIAVFENGEVNIGPGYNIGQILEAIEVARRALLGVILRPADGPAENPE